MGHCGGTEIGEVVDSKIAEESKGVINKDERGGGGKIARGRAQGAPTQRTYCFRDFLFSRCLKSARKVSSGPSCGLRLPRIFSARVIITNLFVINLPTQRQATNMA
jgi:hypothetical protein